MAIKILMYLVSYIIAIISIVVGAFYNKIPLMIIGLAILINIVLYELQMKNKE